MLSVTVPVLGECLSESLRAVLVDTELSLLLAGYTVGLQFILHRPEASSGALKERWVQAISLGQDLLGLYRTVGSPVCDRLGTRAWQGMAATTTAFRHHLTSLHLPSTPCHPLS